MKKLFYILLLITGVAHGQTSTDPYTVRLAGLGMGVYAGSDFSDQVYSIAPTTSYFTMFKPVRFLNYTTTQQNALTGLSAGFLIYNTDSSTLSMYNGSTWSPLSTKAYARSVGGGGGGGGSGDVISNETSNTNDQLPLFGSETDGKHLKKFTGSGLISTSSGVVSAITTSAGISSAISDEVGSGGALVFNLSPTFGTSIISPIVYGSSANSGNLQISSTSGSPKGNVTIGNFSYNEATNVATFAGNILNNSASAYDIGATGSRYRYFYGQGISFSSNAGAANTINFNGSGGTLTNPVSLGTTGTIDVFTHSSAASSATAGVTTMFQFGPGGFTPPSGTAIFNFMRLRHTINQTGGANGTVTTLFLDATCTSCANYFALRTTQGKIQFNALADVTTPDSLIAYEDGELKKVAATTLFSTGTYTPTLTNTANIDASSVIGTTLYYQRIGNQVTVWGTLSIDPTSASAATTIGVSLPVASAMTTLSNLSGQISSWASGGGFGTALADATNDRAQVDFLNGTATTSTTYTIRFSYEVL